MEVERERRLVGRWCEPFDAPAVLECPVDHREERGRVVELDVAGERRFAREHDRGREDGEDGDGGSRRPRGRGSAGAAGSTWQAQGGDARISGRVSRAVWAKSVVKSPITTMAAKPSGRTSAGWMRVRLQRATARPQPRHISARSSGKTSQGRKRFMAPSAGDAQRTGTTWPESARRRASSAEGWYTSTW